MHRRSVLGSVLHHNSAASEQSRLQLKLGMTIASKLCRLNALAKAQPPPATAQADEQYMVDVHQILQGPMQVKAYKRKCALHTYLCSNSQSYSLRTCKGKHGVKGIRFAVIRRTPLSLTPVAPQILGEGFFLVYWNTSLPPALRQRQYVNICLDSFAINPTTKQVSFLFCSGLLPHNFVLLSLINLFLQRSTYGTLRLIHHARVWPLTTRNANVPLDLDEPQPPPLETIVFLCSNPGGLDCMVQACSTAPTNPI